MQSKVVIITGASSGIGAASAKLLAAKGAKVVLGARREDKLKQLVDEISVAGGEAIYQTLDVTRQADNDAIVKLAKDTYGKVEIKQHSFCNFSKFLSLRGFWIVDKSLVLG